MFGPITLPFGAKMLFNTVTLKPGITFEDIELAVGELCSVVKETYGGDKGGFLAGQVFRFSGLVSEEGTLSASKTAESAGGRKAFVSFTSTHQINPSWSICPSSAVAKCSATKGEKVQSSRRVGSPKC